MGCDIHGRVQVKRWKGQEKWSDFGEIPRGRNYALFGNLAGVRAYYVDGLKTISEPRGYPSDFTFDENDDHEIHHFSATDVPCTQLYWMGDHSHSWLSLDEMLAWDGWDERADVWLKFLAYLKASDFVEVRVVFGFDS